MNTWETFRKNITQADCVAIYEYVYDGGDTPTFLYEFYMDDMPYGTAKARDGDPDNWLADHIDSIENDFADEIERGRPK